MTHFPLCLARSNVSPSSVLMRSPGFTEVAAGQKRRRRAAPQTDISCALSPCFDGCCLALRPRRWRKNFAQRDIERLVQFVISRAQRLPAAGVDLLVTGQRLTER